MRIPCLSIRLSIRSSARAAALAGLLTATVLAAGGPAHATTGRASSPSVAPAVAPAVAPVAALVAAPAAAKASGMVSLTFDDGKVAQAGNTAATLERNGMRGTYYVIAEAMSGWGLSSYLDADAVKDLAARGHEIGDHSSQHYNLVDVEAGQVEEFPDAEADLANAQRVFRAETGLTPKTCAYPYGQSDDGVRAAAQRVGLRACRGTSPGENRPGALQRYDLTTMYVTRDTTVSEIKAAARAAKADRAWVIYVWHNVVDDPSDLDIDEDVLTSTFDAQIAAIKSTGVPVKTVDQALTTLGL